MRLPCILFEPAIDLAKKGVIVTEKQLNQLESHRNKIRDVSGNIALYTKIYKVGDTIKYNALANTLALIAKNGDDEFYLGETAKKIVSFLKSKRGILTIEDLSRYKAI